MKIAAHPFSFTETAHQAGSSKGGSDYAKGFETAIRSAAKEHSHNANAAPDGDGEALVGEGADGAGDSGAGMNDRSAAAGGKAISSPSGGKIVTPSAAAEPGNAQTPADAQDAATGGLAQPKADASAASDLLGRLLTRGSSGLSSSQDGGQRRQGESALVSTEAKVAAPQKNVSDSTELTTRQAATRAADAFGAAAASVIATAAGDGKAASRRTDTESKAKADTAAASDRADASKPADTAPAQTPQQDAALAMTALIASAKLPTSAPADAAEALESETMLEERIVVVTLDRGVGEAEMPGQEGSARGKVHLEVLHMETHFEPRSDAVVLVEGAPSETARTKTSAAEEGMRSSPGLGETKQPSTAAEDAPGQRLSFDEALARLGKRRSSAEAAQASPATVANRDAPRSGAASSAPVAAKTGAANIALAKIGEPTVDAGETVPALPARQSSAVNGAAPSMKAGVASAMPASSGRAISVDQLMKADASKEEGVLQARSNSAESGSAQPLTRGSSTERTPSTLTTEDLPAPVAASQPAQADGAEVSASSLPVSTSPHRSAASLPNAAPREASSAAPSAGSMPADVATADAVMQEMAADDGAAMPATKPSAGEKAPQPRADSPIDHRDPAAVSGPLSRSPSAAGERAASFSGPSTLAADSGHPLAATAEMTVVAMDRSVPAGAPDHAALPTSATTKAHLADLPDAPSLLVAPTAEPVPTLASETPAVGGQTIASPAHEAPVRVSAPAEAPLARAEPVSTKTASVPVTVPATLAHADLGLDTLSRTAAAGVGGNRQTVAAQDDGFVPMGADADPVLEDGPHETTNVDARPRVAEPQAKPLSVSARGDATLRSSSAQAANQAKVEAGSSDAAAARAAFVAEPDGGETALPFASMTGQVAGRIIDALGASTSAQPAPAGTSAETYLRMTAGGAALKTLTIQLQPENLGRLDVSMRLVEGQLTIELAATEANTAKVLAEDREGLRKLLQHAGFSVDEASITIVTRDTSSGQTLRMDAASGSGGRQDGASAQNSGSQHSGSQHSGSQSSGSDTGGRDSSSSQRQDESRQDRRRVSAEETRQARAKAASTYI